MKAKGILTLFLCSLLVFALIFSCKKNDPEPVVNIETSLPGNNLTVASANVAFHLHNYLLESEIDESNVVYTASDGKKILISTAKIIISNIELVKSDGSIYALKDVIVVKSMEAIVIPIGKVPVGNYKSLRFLVGLDSLTNLTSPTIGSPLNDSNLWFNSSAQPDGYAYIRFSGKIDTTSDNSSSDDDLQTFDYKIGTDKNKREVVMPDKNFTVSEGITNYIHMTCNYYNLFNGIQLNNPENLSISTKSKNSDDIATALANNIVGMFAYED